MCCFRVLYCVLNGTLNPVKYGLPEATWKRTLRVGSLAFNIRSGDTRPSYERLMYPSLVDIGWSEATIPDISAKPGSSTHFRVQEQRYMNAGGKEMVRDVYSSLYMPLMGWKLFSHGSTEVLNSSTISEMLKETFAAWTASAREPTILLVHNERLTRNALKCLGVDTSQWVFGLKDLLGFPSQDVKREDPDSYSRRRRSRSPSPRHSIKRGSEPPLINNHRDYSNRPPPSYQWRQNNERTYAPVYIVDVKYLYVNLMRKESGSERITSIAQRFNMLNEDDNGWCAGNEAV